MATIQDVAKKAGVSQTTVSRVLGNSPIPSCRTRDRVLAAVEATGYVPNQAARELRRKATERQRSGIIAYVGSSPEIRYVADQGSNFSLKLVHLSREANAHNLYLLIHWYDITREGNLCRPIFNQVVDGMIGTLVHAKAVEAMAAKVPTVLLDARNNTSLPVPAVNLDEKAGIRELAVRLAALGHTRVVYFRPTEAIWQYGLRWSAFQEAAAEFGFRPPVGFDQVRTINRATHDQAMAEFADQVAAGIGRGEITAIMCPGDQYAGTLMGHLAARGWHAPWDYSITGFDDTGYLVPQNGPGLTSVRYPMAKMAAIAMEILGKMLQGQQHGIGEILVCPEIIMRESCGAPPKPSVTARESRKINRKGVAA